MSTITSTFSSRSAYGREATDVAVRTPAKPAQQGFWARLLTRMVEARRREAERELRRHGLHLPSELEMAGWKINERNEDSLPFVR
jgi:hypothetical protein